MVQTATYTPECNVDCALFNNNTIKCYGFRFHNSSGNLVSGVSNFDPNSCPLPEALGLYEAIEFAIAQDMPSIIFEFDYKIIVNKLRLETSLLDVRTFY